MRVGPSVTAVIIAAAGLLYAGSRWAGPAGQTKLRWTDETPSWSPNGREIVFASNRANAKTTIDHLYLMKANGTGVKRLTRDALDAREPSFSPDGEEIVYVANVLNSANTFTEASTVETITAKGTGERALTSMGGDLEQPSWSPNGRWIAFVDTVWNGSEATYRTDLYIVQPDGSGLRRLAINVDGWAFAWSPDSKEIAVGGGGDDHLIQIHVNAGRPIRLASDYSNVITDIAWSPDASRIAVVRGRTTWDGSGDINPRRLAVLDLQTRTERRLGGVVDSESVGSFATTITWLPRPTPTLAIFDGARIRLVDANGRNRGSVNTTHWGQLYVGSASRDGNQLLIVDGPSGSKDVAISVANIRTRRVRPLTQRATTGD